MRVILFGATGMVGRRPFPRQVTTTVNVGRAMAQVAVAGYPRRILDPEDINRLATGSQ